ncbi:hypothetical protein F5X98DRAFT_238452 [Xylaria grammica]|nr:hypothetical protein F5X98DRAFT_238452 [Xylaria grammica]
MRSYSTDDLPILRIVLHLVFTSVTLTFTQGILCGFPHLMSLALAHHLVMYAGCISITTLLYGTIAPRSSLFQEPTIRSRQPTRPSQPSRLVPKLAVMTRTYLVCSLFWTMMFDWHQERRCYAVVLDVELPFHKFCFEKPTEIRPKPRAQKDRMPQRTRLGLIPYRLFIHSVSRRE